jgi:hypothetical protein
MRLRACVGLFLALALALLPSQAVACNVEDIAVGSAGPGDTFGWSIGNMTPGASYSVTFNGRKEEGKAAQNGSASGTFTMPDLGDREQDVPISALITHPPSAEDPGTFHPTGTVHYVPPSPPTAPPPPPTGGPGPTASPTSGVGEAADHGLNLHRPTIASSVSSGAAGGHNTADTADAAYGATSASAPASAAAEAARAGAPASAKRSGRARASVLDHASSLLGDTTRIGPAEVPNLALGLAALIFVLGTAVTAFVIYILNTGPDPRAAIRSPAPPGPDPLESELQEILATEMAGSLLAQLSLDGAGLETGSERPQADSSSVVRTRNP